MCVPLYDSTTYVCLLGTAAVAVAKPMCPMQARMLYGLEIKREGRSSRFCGVPSSGSFWDQHGLYTRGKRVWISFWGARDVYVKIHHTPLAFWLELHKNVYLDDAATVQKICRC